MGTTSSLKSNQRRHSLKIQGQIPSQTSRAVRNGEFSHFQQERRRKRFPGRPRSQPPQQNSLIQMGQQIRVQHLMIALTKSYLLNKIYTTS